MHLEILHSLVLSPSCPKPVLALCSPNIASLLYEKKKQPPLLASFNVAAIRQVLADAIGMKGGGGKDDMNKNVQHSLLISEIDDRVAHDGSFGRTDLVPTSPAGRPDYLYYGSIT